MSKEETFNDDGQLHSFDDKPASVYSDGSKFWFKNGKIHRDNDKPAVITCRGIKYWYKDGFFHRINGKPAIIYKASKRKRYFINGSELTDKQIKLLKKINSCELKQLPWLLNEDQVLNCVIEERINTLNKGDS